VFLALLWRDVFVTGREFWVFLVQVAIQLLFIPSSAVLGHMRA
jgi:ABC-2 type transport system permease protein